jgi:hypothetical protein
MEPALFRFIGSGISKQFMSPTGAAQRGSPALAAGVTVSS